MNSNNAAVKPGIFETIILNKNILLDLAPLHAASEKAKLRKYNNGGVNRLKRRSSQGEEEAPGTYVQYLFLEERKEGGG